MRARERASIFLLVLNSISCHSISLSLGFKFNILSRFVQPDASVAAVYSLFIWRASLVNLQHLKRPSRVGTRVCARAGRAPHAISLSVSPLFLSLFLSSSLSRSHLPQCGIIYGDSSDNGLRVRGAVIRPRVHVCVCVRVCMFDALKYSRDQYSALVAIYDFS